MAGYTGPAVIYLTSDGKLYRYGALAAEVARLGTLLQGRTPQDVVDFGRIDPGAGDRFLKAERAEGGTGGGVELDDFGQVGVRIHQFHNLSRQDLRLGGAFTELFLMVVTERTNHDAAEGVCHDVFSLFCGREWLKITSRRRRVPRRSGSPNR